MTYLNRFAKFLLVAGLIALTLALFSYMLVLFTMFGSQIFSGTLALSGTVSLIMSGFAFSLVYLFDSSNIVHSPYGAMQSLINRYLDKQLQSDSVLQEDYLFYQTIARLRSDFEQTLRTCKANLIWGTGFAIIGLVYMAVIVLLLQTESSFVYKLPVGAGVNLAIVFFLTSNFTIVIIIEGISFFYLKNYDKDRSLLRYLRNEITNIEQIYLGIIISARSKDRALVKDVAISLIRTERNFVLKKGEETAGHKSSAAQDFLLERMIDKLADATKSPIRNAKAG